MPVNLLSPPDCLTGVPRCPSRPFKTHQNSNPKRLHSATEVDSTAEFCLKGQGTWYVFSKVVTHLPWLKVPSVGCSHGCAADTYLTFLPL